MPFSGFLFLSKNGINDTFKTYIQLVILTNLIKRNWYFSFNNNLFVFTEILILTGKFLFHRSHRSSRCGRRSIIRGGFDGIRKVRVERGDQNVLPRSANHRSSSFRPSARLWRQRLCRVQFNCYDEVLFVLFIYFFYKREVLRVVCLFCWFVEINTVPYNNSNYDRLFFN